MNAVKNYLVGRGVSTHQIEAVGTPELKPITDDDTAAGRAQNRRVELVFIQR